MSATYLITGLAILGLFVAFIYNVIYPMVINSYFKSDKFFAVKDIVVRHIDDCNDLNGHIEHLKFSYTDVESSDYGTAQLSDTSLYNMNRPKWVAEMRDKRTHRCSSSVAKNAENQPYKYFCKYFNIKPDEQALEKFEQVLNNFSAVEQGKYLLANERDKIVSSVSGSIPSFILDHHRDRVNKELGFQRISLSNIYFPVYTFQYVSAGGNSSFKTTMKLDIEWLEGFIGYLANLVKFNNSIAGQRALMTSKLREQIKVRDSYTCQICSLSTEDEPNLLLEIDHIIPLSKGGITSEGNLQVLCWKCNRSKGSKIYSAEIIPNPVPTLVNGRLPMSTGVDIHSNERLKVERDVGAVANKLDTTWPPKTSALTSSTKLDMTRPPKASASTSSTKLDMTRPPKASASTNSISEKVIARTAVVKATTNLTRPQINALRSAKEYLEYSGYSRVGLIEQLREGDNYAVSDATVAVDSLNVDWNKQAVKSAKEYLEYSGYSYDGLIEQLHDGDNYTVSEATYGAKHTVA